MLKADERTKEMKALRKKGWSITKIGIFFGVSRQRIHQIIGNTGNIAKSIVSVKALRNAFASEYLQTKGNLTTDEASKDLGIKNVSRFWAGKRHAVKNGSQLSDGMKIEEYVSDLLKEQGIGHKLTNSRGYDIILDNGKTIEIRARFRAHKIQTNNFYLFPLAVKMNMDKPADFFVLVIVNNDKKDCFVIPKKKIPSGMSVGFTWPKSESTQGRFSEWVDYHNRFDLLK